MTHSNHKSTEPGIEQPEPYAVKHCTCGAIITEYFDAEQDELDILLDIKGTKMVDYGIERACKHNNGTIIVRCPACDLIVYKWGMGPLGSMECECWN